MKKYAILSMMLVLALGACDDDDEDTLGPSNSAEVRVVNASTGVASVGLFRGGSQLLGGVGFQTASACDNLKRVPAGNQTLEFRSTASPTTTKTVQHNFVAGQRYLVLLSGPSNNLVATVFEDPAVTNATTGNNRLRFINTTTTAGDIFATANTTANPTGAATVANLAGGASTSGTTMFREVPTGNAAFRLYNVGATTNPRGTYTLSTTGFPASRNATIVFTDAATGSTTTGFQVNACS